MSFQVQYCNLGYTLERADVNHDQYPDLIIGLPYYSSEYEQSGIVAAFMSSKQIKSMLIYCKSNYIHSVVIFAVFVDKI